MSQSAVEEFLLHTVEPSIGDDTILYMKPLQTHYDVFLYGLFECFGAIVPWLEYQEPE